MGEWPRDPYLLAQVVPPDTVPTSHTTEDDGSRSVMVDIDYFPDDRVLAFNYHDEGGSFEPGVVKDVQVKVRAVGDYDVVYTVEFDKLKVKSKRGIWYPMTVMVGDGLIMDLPKK